ncbi:hypothetical protein [Peribacillus cavernae]|uniref:hypothetical protein n=1 Tax=Peribacillus cavernae TaxID=1674310 RepID=UPI00278978A2|nr:hypothetical protein [Peribacillus cavernae]MDQ0217900.1 hypothetical protein [Peribacillus cavernae]
MDVIEYSVVRDDFIDKELANVFLYQSQNRTEDIELQPEEVSGIVRAEFDDFKKLCFGRINEIKVQGFEIDAVGKKATINKSVSKNEFVPHGPSYYENILGLIGENI